MRASTSVPCPLCGGSSDHALTVGDRNRRTTGERFDYNRCQRCATVFMLDVPPDLSRYYADDYHQFGSDREPLWRTDPVLLEAESFRVQLILRHVSPGSLVDIGAGPGGFASAAAEAGFQVTAIEMDARCCEYLSDRLGVRAICSNRPVQELRRLAPARVITLWHVLEHLEDQAEMLAAAAERLEPGGVLALGVPNPQSLQFRLLRGRWAHLDAPRHLRLAPAQALIDHLRPLGLRPVEHLTDDPFGRACNLHGWAYALRRDPASGPTPVPVAHLAGWITRLLSPVEHRAHRGAALTLVFVKDAV